MGSLEAESRSKADSVCIIGAGPSGVAAAKYLAAERAFSRITVFEQRSRVGGIWNYVPYDEIPPEDAAVPQTNPRPGLNKPVWRHSNASDVVGQDTKEQAAFLTPLYDRLETNIPRSLMGFSDLNWPENTPLFPKHDNVLAYLEHHAEDVRHLISFNTQVLDVHEKDDGRWLVKTQEVSKDEQKVTQEHDFDAVIVANGHYDVPYIPAVSGIEAWTSTYPGVISHSKLYRKPEHYSGKKVIVVGNSASGIDIGAQIATVSRHPLLMSQKSESYLQVGASSPDKQEKPEIIEYILKDRSVRFADGTVESNIDSILYCTGYFYSFPFFNNLDPPLITTGERVENTYLHTFYRSNPSLAFTVLNQKVIPFPFAEAQAAVIARVFSGRLTLPSPGEMEDWEVQTTEEMGNGRTFHVLKFPKDAEFINMLHDWAVSVDGQVETNEPKKMGKTPPRWGEKEFWTRERFPSIKKAFQNFGEQRHQKRGLEDVGYSFEQWKKEKADTDKRLL
ncbi:flavin-dependent monooxygenase-like protein [Dothistroma septosporum NZE10]|uniref:Flavin-dependent monooxygenase-like protein n=1 Tax=Dothistroma septosporum (strain NZE10 / CBS 128990) TaxID=675120 RepID=M2Y2E3_DOTSN|nr:flavin-dependent monooxygenase-like protein [Dothistroma septosporum NZE10]